jgi:uncharacterized protein (DUF924 family)
MSTIERTSDRTEPPWVEEVLRFWFQELGADLWFVTNDEVDTKIRARFLGVHEKIANGAVPDTSSLRALLAAVIVLDQFSRNMFRGTPRAFATDTIARSLARRAIAIGFDVAMTPEERYFFYLPFEHSEDREDQALSVRLIGQLGSEDWTRYALAHQATIERFGRFPHRNAILGRTSRPDEVPFVDQSFSRKL